MKFAIKTCPVCGHDIDKVKEDWAGEYKDQKYIVHDLEYYLCRNCGERVYPHEAMRKIEASSPAFHDKELVK